MSKLLVNLNYDEQKLFINNTQSTRPLNKRQTKQNMEAQYITMFFM